MNEIEARRLIRRYGWTACVRQKSSGRYLWARKRVNGKLVGIYIAAMSRLDRFEPPDVLGRLPDVA